jgi:hypothetical protein
MVYSNFDKVSYINYLFLKLGCEVCVHVRRKFITSEPIFKIYQEFKTEIDHFYNV